MRVLLQINRVDPAWETILLPALEALDASYREFVMAGEGYIPAPDRLLAAFSTLKPENVRYILFGQDPYPRPESAIGYAFIDGRVERIFSPTGLDSRINRATSLRNFVKMALVADGRLDAEDTSQAAIATLDKSDLIDTMDALRCNFEHNGVLLLNAALLFTHKEDSKRHIKAWQGFVETLLQGMTAWDPTLILFGTHARAIEKLHAAGGMKKIALEHPYNTTFITNPDAYRLFGPMALFKKY